MTAQADDLVQRLRERAEQNSRSGHDSITEGLLWRAADEIVRLQADNQRLHDENVELRGFPPGALAVRAETAEARAVRLQQALSDAYDTLVHVRTMHQPEWASEQAKAAGKDPWVCLLCGTADGHWPCDTADITDDALAAARAVLEGNKQ